MTRSPAATRGVLSLSCPDRIGIVHAVSGFLAKHGFTIVQSQQFGAEDTGTFFMRVEFAVCDGESLDIAALSAAFAVVADDFGMTFRMVDASSRQRLVIMVSKFAHCLNDLLFRASVGGLDIDVVAVVSNHPDLGRLADHYGVPFRHIPVTPDTKKQAETELLDLVERERVDLVVLARYMQILSDETCHALAGRAINIHHSMLPSFKGARPYHQAHARGVKVIGATAHYVTADLDEGPIIEQEVLRVNHTMSAETFAARGRETESKALATAVRWHTENRVVLNGSSTVVLL
ncbi:formyltetrahydrofolate deformylase [Mycolicibacterium sp. CBMA 226]|uniref:formyltetrahydrofolate deformylase n=1 Tax=Mycolicibacterium sp. CBMA 226 TaxID=2606611 RepID=UPI00130C193D|nr:formyltetrahydrofolate deformylase [Mycolicibacterium sp. CBMA 226]MUL78999.1 formyltetrahydrofolate deformylase [Mycolicibacterium sp. CBMA 226]QGW61315.1 Formyltetrahydrofolate deformylase [Mycolicibacterium sp.]